ncbi:MAG: hypothetical protein WA210_22010 [Burkholderiaceae bacterium]
MKKTLGLVLLASLFALGGCAAKWSRPNTSESVFYQDRYQCEQDAARAYPPAMVQSMTSPGFQAAPRPSQTNCTSVGNQISCRSAPQGLDASIYNTPPTYVSEDMNVSNRNSAVQSCLFSKGYRVQ